MSCDRPLYMISISIVSVCAVKSVGLPNCICAKKSTSSWIMMISRRRPHASGSVSQGSSGTKAAASPRRGASAPSNPCH